MNINNEMPRIYYQRQSNESQDASLRVETGNPKLDIKGGGSIGLM